MKLVSWNVNGLRACIQKGFLDQFNAFDADFYCLQETKLSEGQLELELPGYEQYWCYAEKKGYSGTAIFTKHTPLSVHYGLDVPELDNEGRMITLEYPEFYLVTCYTPNAQRELARISHRMTWDDAFRAYLQKLDAQKPVILCGDLNVAHQEIDLKNPKSNRGNAGFSDEERQSFQKTLDLGFTDTFRHLHPGATGCYSWWSYMFKAREKNAGWRIDYFLVSDRVRQDVYRAEIHSDILGSDHCPVSIEMDLACNGGIWSPSSLGKAKLHTPDGDSDNEPKASAVKAKALVPFAAIAALILCVCLLWQPLSTFLHPTDHTENTVALSHMFTLRIIAEDFHWLSTEHAFTSSSYSANQPEYVDMLITGSEYFYTERISNSLVEKSNVLLCLELTDAALALDTLPDNPNVEFDSLSYYSTGSGVDENGNILYGVHIHDILFENKQIIPYYADTDSDQIRGWLVTGTITQSADFQVKIGIDDQLLSQQLHFAVPAPYIKKPFTVTSLHLPPKESTVNTSGVNVPPYQLITDGSNHFFSTPDDGPDISAASHWIYITPTDDVKEQLDLSQCHLVVTGGFAVGNFVDEIAPASEDSIIVRTCYTDATNTDIAGWLVYGYLAYDYLSIQLQCPAFNYYSDSTRIAVTNFLHADQAEQMTTEQLVAEMMANDTIVQNIDMLKFGSSNHSLSALMDKIPLLAELYSRDDAIDALMNCTVDPTSDTRFAHIYLMECKEFREKMTYEQVVRFYISEYPSDTTGVDWNINYDDPGHQSTHTLAYYIAFNSSIWSRLELQDTQFRQQVYLILRENSNVLQELELRDDALSELNNVLKELERNNPHQASALPHLIELWPFIESLQPKNMTSAQLVQNILSDHSLKEVFYIIPPGMDSREYYDSLFTSIPILQVLSSRDDAVQALMDAQETEGTLSIYLAYALLDTPTMLQKMTAEQQTLLIVGDFNSNPLDMVFYDIVNDHLPHWSTDELVAHLGQQYLFYGALLNTCDMEVKLEVYRYVYTHSNCIAELLTRSDALTSLENYAAANDPYSKLIDLLIELWPTIHTIDPWE